MKKRRQSLISLAVIIFLIRHAGVDVTRHFPAGHSWRMRTFIRNPFKICFNELHSTSLSVADWFVTASAARFRMNGSQTHPAVIDESTSDVRASTGHDVVTHVIDPDGFFFFFVSFLLRTISFAFALASARK